MIYNKTMDEATGVRSEIESRPKCPPTVLVVDDLPMIRHLVEAYLADSGCQVLLAEGGDEALELIHATAGDIDLLLTDVRMPGMHGPELYRQVHASYPEIKVLFMSGFDAFELARLGYRGDSVLLAKPFGAAELLRRMSGVLGSPCCLTDGAVAI